ncbi:LSU ribosomal protein L25P [Aureimonas altamirensis DSM 21988]|jgi:large subunit ribosomal protein L25|uniref:Large ribosomal subunit protein bL25 n=1 Tax=Aureimonas altamirensis DSM 21988 TaxID=1121026 RepID=A0ABY1IGR6_9HYPH|nr:50S ribosomal protein L25/general stress protein Ctc [Aureimonas altamirensis]SHJ14609.1 LSU ribosomal protein L25P [Aureimonas altamirensis DSM 21988]
MSESYTVKAEAREKVGKGAARNLRRNGKVPAVIYGDKQEPLPIAIDYKETFLRLHSGGFLTTVATIEVGGQQIRVLPKDYQLDVVKDTLVHVDFLRVSAKSVVTVRVPVHFENEDEAPGIKAKNGVLNIAEHDVNVQAPAEGIPDSFTVDLTGLDIGDSVHASQLKLPKGVTLVDDSDFVIASIVAPQAEIEDDVEADASEAAADAEDETKED